MTSEWNSSVASSFIIYIMEEYMMESSVGREGAGTEANRSVFHPDLTGQWVTRDDAIKAILHTCATAGGNLL